MDKKVILISIDGMRPDGALECGNPFVSELMKRGSYNLTEIAMECGFNSSSYFCKVFKNEKGISPTEYRKQLRSQVK